MRRSLLPLLSLLFSSAAVMAAVAAPSTPAQLSVPSIVVPPVSAAGPPHSGYPTTREKWRYCPRDGSHQCVDLDIPGVTRPEKLADQ